MLSGQVADGLMTILAGEMVCINCTGTRRQNMYDSLVTDFERCVCHMIRLTDLAVSSYGTLEDQSSSASLSLQSLVAVCCAPFWGQIRTSWGPWATASSQRCSTLVGRPHRFPTCKHSSLNLHWTFLLCPDTCLQHLSSGWCIFLTFRSMVNCMILNRTSRVALASCRNAFTMVSSEYQQSAFHLIDTCSCQLLLQFCNIISFCE